MKLRVATRKSKLALTQCRHVLSALQSAHEGLEIEEVHVTTQGDRVTDRPLAEVGGKGLFVTEVEAVVARGDADFAVHSLKDVPGDVELGEGMAFAAFPKRAAPWDVFITREPGATLFDLEAGAKVGTTSLRRIVQLRTHRPDLNYLPLRGNVDTRLRKLREGEFDAIVLAQAGLDRLSLFEPTFQVLPRELCVPAVGQGTLALEARADDETTRSLLLAVDDELTRIQTFAERALLKELQGNCHVPIAGLARFEDQRLSLDGLVGSVVSRETITAGSSAYVDPRTGATLEVATALGNEVAKQLVEQGARTHINAALVSFENRKRMN